MQAGQGREWLHRGSIPRHAQCERKRRPSRLGYSGCSQKSRWACVEAPGWYVDTAMSTLRLVSRQPRWWSTSLIRNVQMMCPGSIPGAALGPVSMPRWPGLTFRKSETPAATGVQSQTIGTKMTMTSVPTLLFDDVPRARLTDPLTSHEAADATQATKRAVCDAVELLLMDAGFSGLTDDELNARYADRARMWGWPQVDFETPRRRRSDLTADGLVSAAVFRRPNNKGRNVTVWVLNEFVGGLK